LRSPLTELPVAIAHRGFSADQPENSIAAFTAAVDLGYRYLETDARVTDDGRSVAFHDYQLDRVTNDVGRLQDLPWEVVRKARILGREPIPLLEDVLDTFRNCTINIDIKADNAVGPALDAIRRTASWSRIRLAGFNHARIVAVRAAVGPSVASSLSPREIARLVAAPRRFRLPPGADWAVQVPRGPKLTPLVTARLVESAHLLGMPVHVWTINDVEEMARLLDLGVDGVMTDEALVLKKLLQDRGQWAWPALSPRPGLRR